MRLVIFLKLSSYELKRKGGCRPNTVTSLDSFLIHSVLYRMLVRGKLISLALTTSASVSTLTRNILVDIYTKCTITKNEE